MASAAGGHPGGHPGHDPSREGGRMMTRPAVSLTLGDVLARYDLAERVRPGELRNIRLRVFMPRNMAG
jgi:hypothetical protein